MLFIATRGKPIVPPATVRSPSVIREKRSKHSKKPLSAYVMLERMYEGLTKIDLFARGEVRKGWVGWGNEALPNQPEQVKPPKTLPSAKSPKALVRGNAANDAKVSAAKKARRSMGAKSVLVKKAA